MSTNPPDKDNKKDDKKDGACEINNRLMHGTPSRRKIIKAKRPPMSTPTSQASKVSNAVPTTTSIPADAGIEIKESSLEAELESI